MQSMFDSVKSVAANISNSGERGSYTSEMFCCAFPQFTKCVPAENQEQDRECLVPEPMLSVFIKNANSSVLPSRWGDMWEYAAGLYVAHFAAMYLNTYADSSNSVKDVAVGSQPVGVVKSASMGDSSISYDNSAITSATEKWGSWNSTQYGQQLVTQARLIGMGGMYVI